jgi:hypothetical protein
MSLAREFSAVFRPLARFALVFLFALLLDPGLTFAAAQKSKPAPSSPAPTSAGSNPPPGGSILIGTVASEVGTTAAIPLFYDPAKSGRVQSFRLMLDFVSNSVKFARAEKGVASEGLELEVKAEAAELPPDDKKITHTRLTVDISVSGGDPKQSLPAGLLAFLNFKIPENAKPFSISLNPISITAEDVSKKTVEVAAEPGKVIVSIPDAPLAGCFFFSH